MKLWKILEIKKLNESKQKVCLRLERFGKILVKHPNIWPYSKEVKHILWTDYLHNLQVLILHVFLNCEWIWATSLRTNIREYVGHVLDIPSMLLYVQALSLPLDHHHSNIPKQMNMGGGCASALLHMSQVWGDMWTLNWQLGTATETLGKGHMMNGHTSEEPGHKLKSWHAGETSIYSTDLTHRNCVTACCHRSRGVKCRESLEGWLSGTSGMHTLSWWNLQLIKGVWLPSDFVLQ